MNNKKVHGERMKIWICHVRKRVNNKKVHGERMKIWICHVRKRVNNKKCAWQKIESLNMPCKEEGELKNVHGKRVGI